MKKSGSIHVKAHMRNGKQVHAYTKGSGPSIAPSSSGGAKASSVAAMRSKAFSAEQVRRETSGKTQVYSREVDGVKYFHNRSMNNAKAREVLSQKQASGGKLTIRTMRQALGGHPKTYVNRSKANANAREILSNKYSETGKKPTVRAMKWALKGKK